MSCPDCGSEKAVSKAEAWDALHKLSPADQKKFDGLDRVMRYAIAMFTIEDERPDDEVYVAVPRDEYDALRTAVLDMKRKL